MNLRWCVGSGWPRRSRPRATSGGDRWSTAPSWIVGSWATTAKDQSDARRLARPPPRGALPLPHSPGRRPWPRARSATEARPAPRPCPPISAAGAHLSRITPDTGLVSRFVRHASIVLVDLPVLQIEEHRNRKDQLAFLGLCHLAEVYCEAVCLSKAFGAAECLPGDCPDLRVVHAP